MIETWPGSAEPLGAHWDGSGTNFAVFSGVAERVELCLFDTEGNETRAELIEQTGEQWHAYLPGIGPGQAYGYRVHGPWDPARGHRCNPSKLLMDPYAKGVSGELRYHPAIYGHVYGESPHGAPDGRDSSPFVPRSTVVSPYFDWGDDRPPRVPWEDAIVYELHVEGFTKNHPGIPEALRGTYMGLAHPAAIEHLLSLGVTTVELMPIHQFVPEAHLAGRGMRNYWGYNTLSYFAPHAGYARGGHAHALSELKRAVRALHEAGLEVLIDVVYNHTCESDVAGPTLSFRGLDNANYYRLDPNDPRRYLDYTGCGNTLDATHPHVLQMIMDSLRYWVEEVHVDGFRFDLAAAIARHEHGRERMSAFLDVVQQDPVVGRAKLVAEPWDVGEGGYQVGRFPALWSEWNGRYRDAIRSFWRADPGRLGELATRLSGSPDLYERTGRKPFASINFVTAHDGFTLRDLTSYEHKHNEANGEDNKDGENHNLSTNYGVEGETQDREVRAMRVRAQKNFLATLFFSQGVPQITAGHEMGHSQGGNNNGYCQPELGWLDWTGRDREVLETARALAALRRQHPVLRRRFFFQGHREPDPHAEHAISLPDVGWYRPDAQPMRDHDWQEPSAHTLGVFLNGENILSRDRRGRPIVDDSFFLIISADRAIVPFSLPALVGALELEVALDTSNTLRVGSLLEEPRLEISGPAVIALRHRRSRASLMPM